MSLQVWLPLNGNLDNQGLSDITVTNVGATVDDSGKIGKCYSFDGNDYFSLSYNSFDNEWSYSIWFYTTTNNTQTLACCRNDIGYGFSIFLISNKLRIDGIIKNINQQWTTDYTYSTNTWTNLIITSKNGLLKYYINGEHKDSKTVTVDNSKLGNIFTFGASQANGNNLSNYFSGKINDVRIYDHALSLLEVKQISQGLVLHYPLNHGGFGQENLLPCGGTYTKDSPRTTSLKNGDGYSFVPNSAFEGKPSTTYTVSVECDGNLASGHVGTSDPTKRYFTFWVYICKTDTTQNWQNGSYDTPVCLTNSNHNYRKIGNTHVWTITLSSTQKYISLRTNSYSNGTDVVTMSWWNMKVEEGDKFTGWSPNTSSTLATTLGLNSNIEYDCSGFGNNGSKSGTITYSNDTPRYNVSTKFNSTSSKIQLPAINFTEMANSYTFSWWQYNTSDTNMPWGFSDGNRLNLYHTSPLCWNTGDGTKNPFKDGGTTISPSSVQNNWHHMVVTGDGISTKLYIDGAYKGTAITYRSITGTKIWISGWNSGTSFTFNNSMESDFRIYATALSAEDIQNLYTLGAAIDSSNNLYTYQLNET